MSQNTCDCCTGIESLTPRNTANRPGLDRLAYRVGTQAAFLETMQARLAATYVELPPQTIGDWQLRENDIRHLPRLALRLAKAGDPFTVYLRGQFPDELAQLLAGYQGEDELPKNLPSLLLAALNEVLQGTNLYDSARLRHLNLSQTIHNLARQESLTGDELTRLNRLILEAAYPDLIVTRQRVYPLRALTTRSVGDPAIAMLDAWAMVADVLTFYQERIANEGYLGTAVERRSILELARLVGYKLRPGVAATVYLAFTMENGYVGDIPAGTRAQSVPNPGETAQFFETEETLPARAEWNDMLPRMNRPLPIYAYNQANDFPYIYLQGTDLNLNPGDPLLFTGNDDPDQADIYFIESVEILSAENRTKIRLQGAPKESKFAFLNAVKALIAYYLDFERHGVSDDSQMVRSVKNDLYELMQNLTPDSAAEELLKLTESILSSLSRYLEEAQKRKYSKLEPWLDGMVADLWAVAYRYAESLMMQSPDQRSAAPPGEPWFKIIAVERDKSVTIRTFDFPANLTLTVELGLYGSEAINPILVATIDSGLGGTFDRTFSIPEPLHSGDRISIRVENPDVYFHAYNWFYNKTTDINVISLQKLGDIQDVIAKPPSLQPSNALRLPRDVRQILDPRKESIPRLLTNLQPATADHLYQAWQNITISEPSTVFVYALREKAAPFGHNAPLRTETQYEYGDDGIRFIPQYSEWDLHTAETDPGIPEQPNVIWLDGPYEQIKPDSWIVLNRHKAADDETPPKRVITQVTSVEMQSRADYGISGKSTRLELSDNWLWQEQEYNASDGNFVTTWKDDFSVIRGTAVYAQSEQLTLAEEPVTEAIGFNETDEEAGKRIELDGLYDGLEAGRWLVVSGEREDIEANGETVTGVRSSELVMLAGVEQSGDEEVPGETPHTTLILANNLAYRYKRETVTVNANVAKSSHGETVHEILGSGDGSKPFQTFTLKRPPLTHLSAPTASGTESTLELRVNDVQWREADNLVFLNANDRHFATRQDNEGDTHVTFGNGERGARLPTGAENVTAVYRSGIGSPGNVKAKQIKLLATKPLGVKSVINPMRASGGGDAEERDQARRNTPLPLMALDRLVSVQDYADFARSFAGIGKAQAARLSDGRQQIIYVTIAGEKDIPIDKTADLYRNLRQALHQWGDPFQPVQVELRELALLVISAKVRIHPDYLWEAVEPQIRQALLTIFSFDGRSLGQDVMLSEVYSAIQKIPGVVYADVDTFGAIPEKQAAPDGSRVTLTPTDIAAAAQKLIAEETLRPRLPVNLAGVEAGGLRPAQISYLSPDIPDTLILTEKSV